MEIRSTPVKKKTISLTVSLLIAFSICLGGLLLTSIPGYAATVPSYDWQKTFPAEPRDYQQVFRPADVDFDLAGNKYVADVGHHAIIKYDPAGQYVTHWTVFNPIVLTVDLSTNHIYVGLTNNEVHIFDENGNLLHTFGGNGTGDGQFNWIKDIAVDDMYIYIADRSNHRVQIFHKSDWSYLTSVGGSGTGNGQLNYPSGLAVGSGRHLYVADTSNGRIQLFTFDSGTSTWDYHSKLDMANPQSLSIQEMGGGNSILYVFHPSVSTSKWSSVAISGHDLDSVDLTSVVTDTLDPKLFTGHINSKLAWHPVEERLYVIDRTNIVRIDDEFNRGNWIGVSLDQFNTPGGIALDRSGNIYITDPFQHRVMIYAQDGSFVNSWGEIGSGDGELLRPKGIAVDSAGHIYIADTENYRIQKFTSDGTFIRKWGEQGRANGKFEEIRALAIDANDHVYVASWRTVQKFDGDGNHLLTFGDHLCGTTGHAPCTDPGKMFSPSGVGFDSMGYVYISDSNQQYINKFAFDGTFIARWGGSGAALGQFNNPKAIAVDHADRIHVIDAQNNRIQLLQTNGTPLGEFGRTPLTSGNMEDIAFDQTNRFYVLDKNQFNVKVFKSRAPGPITDLTATGGYRQVTLTFSAANGATSVTVKQRELGALTWIDATTRYSVTASSTEATVIGLEEDTQYEFKLVVTGGPHAGDSNIAIAKTFERLEPINDLAAIGGDREITLTFSPPTGATSVVVKMWDEGSSSWVDATTTEPITAGATSATVIGLADDTFYSFHLEVTEGPRAGLSNTAGARTNPAPVVPIPISDLAAVGGDRTATLTFSAPVGATAVTVKQAVYDSGTWVDATTVSPVTETSTSAVVTGLADDTKYQFYLEVTGGSYAGNSNIAVARTNPAPVVPIPISDLAAVGGDRSVTLTFSAPTGATAVTVKQAVYGSGLWTDATTASPVTETSTSAVVTGLADGTKYEFYLEVTGGAHAGDSNIAVATTNAAPITPPSGGSRGGGSSSSSSGSIHSAELTGIEVSSGTLRPSFTSWRTSYSLQVGHEVEELEIKAIPRDRQAKIEINEMLQADDELISVPLKEGINTIKITVTSRNNLTKTYTLQVTRAAPESRPEPLPITLIDIAGHWAEQKMKQAVQEGLVSGYPDQSFRPDQPVTRAEFVAFLARSMDWTEQEYGALSFTDHADIPEWAEKYIAQAVHKGIITGYGDGSFKPQQTITRAEAVVMVIRSLGVAVEQGNVTHFADDQLIPTWAKGYVAKAIDLELVSGRGNNQFVPNESITRAESVVLLLQLSER